MGVKQRLIKCAREFILRWLHTPRNQSRWWRLWPESEPRAPRRNETPSQRGKREHGRHRRLACTHGLQWNKITQQDTLKHAQSQQKPLWDMQCHRFNWQSAGVHICELQISRNCSLCRSPMAATIKELTRKHNCMSFACATSTLPFFPLLTLNKRAARRRALSLGGWRAVIKSSSHNVHILKNVHPL